MTDEVTIKIKAGRGGDGAVSFLREKFRPNGGPDGGDGGNGGSIIFQADNNVNTLTFFDSRKHFEAEDGQPGLGKKMAGKNGEDLILIVPQGTTISENGRVIVDLLEKGAEFVATRGGNGGWGNSHFASSIKQAPEWSKKGLSGEEKEIKLDLKLIADIGLVGLPNAGKSTLLARISNAKPKIADYPFTTLEPNLGVANIFGRETVFADIPGLIEGASKGKGLGDKFLRHIERTRELLMLISAESENPVGDYQTLIKELGDFSPKLLKKRRIVAISKSDIVDDKTQRKIARDFGKYSSSISTDSIQASEKSKSSRTKSSNNKLAKISPIFFSAATGENLDELFSEIIKFLK
ncbi:MAG: GTPase ObgE [Candidatus Berkelbacteria bacterium]|nr:GTPase ObgE [Candidatus Berkelbacteria bacterium]